MALPMADTKAAQKAALMDLTTVALMGLQKVEQKVDNSAPH